MFKYFPHTESDTKLMLEKLRMKSLDDLFCHVDPKLIKKDAFNIPKSHSEHELRQKIKTLGLKNKPLLSFLGAGTYESFDFSVATAITSRQEFLTSYTPYQPEIAQGTLQYIFEWQSMICELTGMDVTNASMYDGATATAEAMFMAHATTRRKKVLISSTVNPNTIEVVKTYAKYRDLEVGIIDSIDEYTSLKDELNDDIASVIVQQPNYYGVIEDYEALNALTKNNGSMLIMNVDPSTLSILKTPREWGADIVCGDAQSMGIPASFGGPYVGFLATTTKLMRKLPGRICGMTNDVDGKRGFVLTLQAREQHIRREKANSNICSNQSLMALHVVTIMSLLGKKGLSDVAKRAYSNAHYLHDRLLKTGYFKKSNNHPFFKEFVLTYTGDIDQLQAYLLEKGILAGLKLANNKILFYASEVRTKSEMDDFVSLIGDFHVR